MPVFFGHPLSADKPVWVKRLTAAEGGVYMDLAAHPWVALFASDMLTARVWLAAHPEYTPRKTYVTRGGAFVQVDPVNGG